LVLSLFLVLLCVLLVGLVDVGLLLRVVWFALFFSVLFVVVCGCFVVCAAVFFGFFWFGMMCGVACWCFVVAVVGVFGGFVGGGGPVGVGLGCRGGAGWRRGVWGSAH